MYTGIYKIRTLIFLLIFIFTSFPVFWRIPGVFKLFLLVYTNILEQKRIAGQAQNAFILILFVIFLILH